MKKRLAILLSVIFTLSLFTGCKKDEGLLSKIKKSIFNEVSGPKTGPVGNWDIPIPEINPLGSQNLYSSTEYEGKEHTVTFVENYQESSRLLSGEQWTLVVADNSGIPLKFLKDYAKKLGANIYSSPYSDRLVFSYQKDEDSIWWGDAQQEDSGYTLSVMKEIHAIPDRTLTFKPKDLGEDINNVSFVTTSKGNRFQTASIALPTGMVKVTAHSQMEKGVLSRKFNYLRELDSVKTSRFVLDDIPQGEGTLIWDISWEQDTAPEEFTFLLQEMYEIPQIKMGDELGALKVCGIPFGEVRVEVPKGGEVVHADGYSLEGDVTPEGDTMFWLPAGYWNVVLEAEGINITSSLSRLVPVNSGEITVLTLPDTLKSTYSNLNSLYATEESNLGGIELIDTKDLTDKATISFVVNDPKKRDIFPTNENTEVVEGGKEVKILDITRQIMPPSIVLLLDSSGSMKGQMDNTIAAAKKFVQGLPDKSFIQVIDFDSEARVLKGITKSEVIKSLSSIKAGGSTVLYDSIMKGLEILNGKARPALVVFSDGVDSSTDPNDVGSSASKEEVIEAVNEASIPLHTIGFGKSPDSTTLKQVAGLSGGEYYPAKDQKALTNVFASINSKFGNSFKLTYERPKEIAKSDTPVVSVVLDNSGSMDIDPQEEEGCGYRIDKVKALFHDFVQKLPEECLTQMINFNASATGGTIINIQQLTSKRKPELLQSIGEMEANGGTPILESIVAAYENIKPVPTTKKVIVYMTDAALEVSEEEQPQFVELLQNIKKDDVQVIWVGMGVLGKEDVFIRAAELSGGRYVVSEDVKVLEATLGEVLTLINQPKTSEKIALSISIDDKTPSGDVINYSKSTMVGFSKPKVSGKAVEPDKVETSTGIPIKRYDKQVAELIYGTDVPSKDVLITKRMPFNIKAENKAMEISVAEAYYFGTFKGVEKPEGKQFLALEIEMKNKLQQKIPYQIPSFTSHFYVNINNNGMYPASEATWLAQTPVAIPGDYKIEIEPGESVKGAMIFIVPDEPILQKSLHFYDTEYGHVSIPLVGTMKQELLKVDKLPTTQPVNITDAFSMTINAAKVVPKLDNVEASEKSSFKVIEANFKAKIQALLDIEPSQRLLYSIDTAQGPLLTKMSDVTNQIPFGFMKPVMLAPASNNMVRFAYQIPNILSNTNSEIIGDLKDGTLHIPVTKGKAYGNPVNKPKLPGDGMEIRVNDLVRLNGIEGYNEDDVILDITIFDKKDGEGTSGFEDAFTLVRNDYVEKKPSGATAGQTGLGNFAAGDGESEYIVPSDNSTGSLLFGIDGDWAVFDNSSRRGLILFKMPSESSKYGWTLRSPFFKGLKEPIRNGSYGSSGLLVAKTVVENKASEEFEKQLSEAIDAGVNKYNTTKAISGKAGYTESLGLSKSEGNKNNIPVPAIVVSGTEKLNNINSIKDFTKAMEKLIWLPSKDEAWHYRYSPEAVLTQGWGNEWDLMKLTEGLLSKLGYRPYRRIVKLTEDGKKKLMKIGEISECNITSLPAIAYVDEEGKSRLFVIPFMKDITKLDDLVYMTANQKIDELVQQTVKVSISIKAESLEKTAASQIGDAADALGGVEEKAQSFEYIDVFSKELSLPTLSLDAMDIGYINVGKGKGDVYKAGVSTTTGFIMGDDYIDTGEYKALGIKITVDLPNQDEITHETSLLEGQTLKGLFHTLGLNLPDLPKEAIDKLQSAGDLEYKAAKSPDNNSVLRWYTRNILNRFIATQSEFDERTAKTLDVTLGRTSRARSIVVTVSMNEKDKKLRTSVDLMQATNEVQSGTKKAQSAYNIGAGLFVSQLEGRALPNGVKAELAEIWGNAPKGTAFSIIMSGDLDRSSALSKMKGLGYPETLLKHIEESGKIFIITDKPTIIDGEKRWAWLEIDPTTYDTISVLDNGSRSGMAGYVMNFMPSIKDCRDYMVGAFIGVDTSIWAVSAFSLSLDDYNDILANAMALVNAVSENLDAVMKGIKEPDLSLGKLELSAGPVNFEMKLKWNLELEANTGNNFDIVNGFKDGAAFYFTHAKAAKK